MGGPPKLDFEESKSVLIEGLPQELKTPMQLLMSGLAADDPISAGVPQWVISLFCKIIAPGIDEFDPNNPHAEAKGKAAGIVVGLWAYYRDVLNAKADTPQEGSMSPQQSKIALAMLAPLAPQLMSKGMAMELDQAANFWKGFAKGFNRAAQRKEQILAESSAIPIYLQMLFFYQQIVELKSVREMRDFLLTRLPENLVGQDPKRLEQICKRIGLKFTSRGRPKKIRHTLLKPVGFFME